MDMVKNYRRIVRLSAVYDIIVTSAFAIPGLQMLQLNTLRKLHESLALSGEFAAFQPTHVFFIALLGSIVTVWSVLRVIHPEPRYGLYDGITRLLFSAHMIIALSSGVSRILLAFLVPELLWGVTQLVGYILRMSAKTAI